MANEIRNERAQLRAALCNGLAISVFTVGLLVPALGGLYNLYRSGDTPQPLVQQIALMLVWFAIALFLHAVGYLSLEEIVENE